MCIGSIVTVACKSCRSTFDKVSYLGCATYEHAREGWEDRTDSIISRSVFSISTCDECSDFDSSIGSDSASLRSVSLAEFDYEVDPSASYYSLGKSSALSRMILAEFQSPLELLQN